jgi:hypothetical protein
MEQEIEPKADEELTPEEGLCLLLMEATDERTGTLEPSTFRELIDECSLASVIDFFGLNLGLALCAFADAYALPRKQRLALANPGRLELKCAEGEVSSVWRRFAQRVLRDYHRLEWVLMTSHNDELLVAAGTPGLSLRRFENE